MRDLEIRGAGNVMGKEQHGHMDKIGYELYSKLLRQQLGEVTVNYQTEIDVGVSAFIPENYISTSAVRMDCYKQIAEIKNDADEQRVLTGMRENYGELPLETVNLLKIARLKEYCSYFGLVKAEISKKTAKLVFANLQSLNKDGLMDAINSNKGKVTLAFEETPCLLFNNEGLTNEEILEEMIKFLKSAIKN